MSNVEKEANRRYRITRGDDIQETSGIDMQRASDFIEGYRQAEKDNELTWENISIIRQIMFNYNRTIRNGMAIPNDKEYCQEVLKQYKENR